MIQIKNGERVWDVVFERKSEGKAYINQEEISLSIVPDGKDAWHILYGSKSFRAELIDFDSANKRFILKVNGKQITMTAHTQIDQLLAQMGISHSSNKAINELKSPMPGLVIDIPVSEGQVIETGQPIIILEAMKMENILKAQSPVTIKKILVQKGKPVEKNEILVQFG